MSDVEEIRIVSNKIDRLEDFALPSQNTVRSLILEGNHILEVRHVHKFRLSMESPPCLRSVAGPVIQTTLKTDF